MANRFWVGGTGTWDASSTANWSATSGGAAGASAPVAADDVFFDANSGTGTVTVASGAACLGMFGRGAGITIDFQTSLTIASRAELTHGTIKLNSFVLTCQEFNGSAANARTLDFGTGKIVLSGNSRTNLVNFQTATNLTVAGSRRFECSYTGSVGTRILNCGAGITEAQTCDYFVLGGTDIVTIQSGGRMRTLDMTGFAGTLTDNGTLFILGNFVIPSGVTYAGSANTITFYGVSSTGTINCGITIDHPITVTGTGLTRTLAANFTMGATRTFTLSNGTFDAAGYDIAVGSFALGSGTKTLTLGSGTWTVAGGWDANTNVANLTVSASTGTIDMTSASAKAFAGGAKTWPTLNQGGAGALTIQQSNTFTNITNTVQPATITLTSGTTQTVTDFDVSGTAGNLITLNASTPGSRATLTDSGGINSVAYVDIKDIAAAGYGEWQAYITNGNVDSGNNIGWVFAEPPPLTASEYQISLKSFTERRSF